MRIDVPLHAIDDNPYQRRVEYGDIGELAGRIAAARPGHPDTLGLLQVPAGRLVADDGELVPSAGGDLNIENGLANGYLRLQLAFGHRRRRAFEYLVDRGAHGYKAGVMPINVLDLDDGQMLDAVWSENYERKDITAVEQAELLQAKLERPLADGSKRSQRTVAEEWGLGRSTIANRLRLLEAPPLVQDANRRGVLSERQCLALLAVDQLAQSVNGNVKWGQDLDIRKVGGWGYTPPAPEKVITWVAEQGANVNVTSDEIRKYVKEALSMAGDPLPTAVAQHEAPEGLAHTRQQLCRGCPKRVNDYCLDTGCLEAKKRYFGEVMARAAAEELGLEYSGAKGPFPEFWEKRKELHALWEAGARCEHLVIGWSDSGNRARLYEPDYISGNRAYQGEGKAGIVLGHVGPIEPGCWPETEEEEEEAEPVHPLDAGADAWYSAARAQLDAAAKKVEEALVCELQEQIREPGVIDALVMLLAGGAYKHDLTVEERAAELVNRTWERGGLWGWQQTNYPIRGMADLAQLADLAGVRHVLEDDLQPEAEAIRILARWAGIRNSDYARDGAAAELHEPARSVWARLWDRIQEAPVGEMNELMELHDLLEMAIKEMEAAIRQEEGD